MRVLVLAVELHLPSVTSLKAKRRILKSLVQRLRNRFNVSVTEVGYQNLWQRSELGLAMVCLNGASADQVSESLYSFLEREHEVQIISFVSERY